MQRTQIDIPTLVRIKRGAVGRAGVYARRNGFTDVVVIHSSGLKEDLMRRLDQGLKEEQITIIDQWSVEEASFEQALKFFTKLPVGTKAILGYGGGKALDTAKYVSFLSRLPYISIPTSLSNDGMCSPQSSLTLDGRRRSLPASMPFGVVIDTEVCLEAPEILWLSGIGDLVAKLTAVADWKLAFHAKGTKVDDFAALLSDSTVFQFITHPHRDLEGVKLLGTALMLNGVSMGVCGSSRPASGSEHLISHALDSMSIRPALHGLQVGVATYLVSLLQKQNSQTIAGLFEKTGFWDAVVSDPFKLSEWIEAVRLAPSMKENFYTVLSSRDCLPEAEYLMRNDPWLKTCFVE